MPRSSLIAVLLLCALAACGRRAPEAGAASTPEPADLVGAYEGRFPCSNCAAIATTVWLRADRTFFVRQRYVGADGAASDENVSLGRWVWDDRAAELALTGAGPERRLARLDGDRWRLKTAAPAEHVLARAARTPELPQRFRLDGMTQSVEAGAPFVECVTGREWPLADGGALKDLKRQQRLVNGHAKPARASIEAHLAGTADGDVALETLVVDRFVTLRPGAGC